MVPYPDDTTLLRNLWGEPDRQKFCGVVIKNRLLAPLIDVKQVFHASHAGWESCGNMSFLSGKMLQGHTFVGIAGLASESCSPQGESV